jgi:hypothetical protein
MILTANKTEVDLFENTEISSQINSPLTNFKMMGDKSYSYNIPASEHNKRAMECTNHQQEEFSQVTIETALSDAGIYIINGNAELKGINEKAITLDCTVPPANIKASFWNKKLREVDLGSQKLTSQKTSTGIEVLSKKDKFYQVSNAAIEKTLEELLFIEGSTFAVLNGNSQFWSHTFKANGGTKEDYLINATADFKYAVESYNTNRSIISIDMFYIDGIFSVVSTDEGFPTMIGFTISFPPKHPVYPSTVFKFLNPTEIKYDDIAFDLKVAKLQYKPYFFPTIYAPYFYNEKNGDYNGYINYKEGSELKLNSFINRTTYPIVPCFTFRFIFEKLFEIMDYKMQVSFWEKWENLSFCSMRDFAFQQPDTTLPFNIYGTIIKFADYMPDWTVLEFFNEFGYLVAAGFDFSQANREVEIKQYNDIFTNKPTLFQSAYKVNDTTFDAKQLYQLTYSGQIDTEASTDLQKEYFSDFPVIKEEITNMTVKERTKIPFKFIPLAEQILNRGNQVSSKVTAFCHSVSESNLFVLSEDRPSPRVFFYDSEFREAKTENATISLSRTGVKSIALLWKAIIENRKGKTVTIETIISSQTFSQISLMKMLQIDNVNYIVKQVSIKVKKSRIFHSATLILEQVS